MAGRLRNPCSIPRRNTRLFSTSKRPDHHWGPPSPLSNGYLGALSPGIKRLGHGAVLSPHTVPKLRKNGTTSVLRHNPLWRAKWEMHLYCFWGNDRSVTPLRRNTFQPMPWMSAEICHVPNGYGVDDFFRFPKEAVYHQSHQVNSVGPPATHQTDTAQFLQCTTAGDANLPLTWI